MEAGDYTGEYGGVIVKTPSTPLKHTYGIPLYNPPLRGLDYSAYDATKSPKQQPA